MLWVIGSLTTRLVRITKKLKSHGTIVVLLRGFISNRSKNSWYLYSMCLSTRAICFFVLLSHKLCAWWQATRIPKTFPLPVRTINRKYLWSSATALIPLAHNVPRGVLLHVLIHQHACTQNRNAVMFTLWQLGKVVIFPWTNSFTSSIATLNVWKSIFLLFF